MSFQNPPIEARCALLERVKTIAVVGLSPNPARPSHVIAARLQAAGYRVIPVRPLVREVLGEKAYARLVDVPERIDLVSVFRASEHLPALAEEVVGLGIPALWAQDGIRDAAAGLRLQAAGVFTVMDECISRDLRRCAALAPA
ncbi:MAG TPA: CoA-binding protein [Pelomicrobium sp.]|nr:CoA-binding protein [Pelomicrobium sp.]